MATPTGMNVRITESQSLTNSGATSNGTNEIRHFERTDSESNGCCTYIVKNDFTSMSYKEICGVSLYGAMVGIGIGLIWGTFFYFAHNHSDNDCTAVNKCELINYWVTGASAGAAIGIIVANFFNCLENHICSVETAQASRT